MKTFQGAEESIDNVPQVEDDEAENRHLMSVEASLRALELHLPDCTAACTAKILPHSDRDCGHKTEELDRSVFVVLLCGLRLVIRFDGDL